MFARGEEYKGQCSTYVNRKMDKNDLYVSWHGCDIDVMESSLLDLRMWIKKRMRIRYYLGKVCVKGSLSMKMVLKMKYKDDDN
ncbi:hypothetical protein Tco_0391012 [Tanacetum coccineum]